MIEAARFANTVGGYAQLIAFTARWEQRRWAVEGCHGAGRPLALLGTHGHGYASSVPLGGAGLSRCQIEAAWSSRSAPCVACQRAVRTPA